MVTLLWSGIDFPALSYILALKKLIIKKKKDRNELVGLYVCYLSEIYMQHYK